MAADPLKEMFVKIIELKTLLQIQFDLHTSTCNFLVGKNKVQLRYK